MNATKLPETQETEAWQQLPYILPITTKLIPFNEQTNNNPDQQDK